jgi:hypothetical protein
VTADGVLDLSYDPDSDGDDGGDDGDQHAYGGPRSLPEGVGRLAYLPQPGLRPLDLGWNRGLAALPEGLWLLTGLEELN